MSRLQRYCNRLHASPSYQDMGETKPKPESIWYRPPLPVRFVLCDKCKRPGGTLLKVSKNIYRHKVCFDTTKNAGL
jgi:hypothetical protein